MRSILSSHDMKILLFLEELNKKRSRVSISQLSDTLKIPIRTLSSYIQEFNDYGLSIKISSSNRGIQLKIPSNTSFRCIYQEIYKRSLELSIIQQLFLSGGQTIDELSDTFFVSSSTIKRSISRVNNILKPDNISISSNQNILSGNEKKIRQFLSFFYLEKYADLEFLNDDEAHILSTLITNLFQELGVKIYKNQLSKYMRWMYINSFRLKFGHRVPLKMTKFTNCSLLNEQTFCKNFYLLFEIPLNISNINDMLFPVNNNLYFYSYNQMSQKMKYNTLIEKELFLIEKTLETIAEELNISLPNSTKEMLLLDLMNVLHLRNYCTFLLYNRREIFFYHLAEKYPHVYSFFIPYLSKIAETPLSNDEKNELLYILLTHWYELYDQLPKIEKCVSIYIHVDTDLEHALFIKKEIEQYCRYNIKCHIMMDTDDYLIENTSILVTTLTKTEEYIQNVICFSDYFSDRNWYDLNLVLEQIVSN